MNRLKNYVRRTILASATEYAAPRKRRTQQSTRSAVNDALRGTDTGWWHDLIYTADVDRLFNRFRSDIGDVIAEYVDEMGTDPGDGPDKGRAYLTWFRMIDACRSPIRADDWNVGNGAGRYKAEAAHAAARFAVEVLADQVARDIFPDL